MADQTEAMHITVPVRGLQLGTGEAVPENVWDREWTFVGRNQIPQIASMGSSLAGNLQQLFDRLRPTAVLLVKTYPHERRTVWDESRADVVLAALNTALLLAPRAGPHANEFPGPVFRVRYPEFCDLPLAVRRGDVISAGHSGRMGLLAMAADAEWLHLRMTASNADIDQILGSASPMLANIIHRATLNRREAKLRDGLFTIQQAFDTLTPGAFVSHLVGAVETLVESEGAEPTASGTWAKRIARMKALLEAYDSRLVDFLVNIRHNYVHAGKQPANDSSTFVALGFALHAWSVLSVMYDRHGDSAEVAKILDAAQLARGSSLPEFTALAGLIPSGPPVPWINHVLSRYQGPYAAAEPIA